MREISIQMTGGFTLIEVLTVVALVGLIAAMTTPVLLRARMSGNEASAIASLRSISSAESAFSSSCGDGGYAQTLADLVLPPTGTNQGFISSDLNANGVVKSGYAVSLTGDTNATTVTAAANTCNASGNDAVSSYFAEDHPVLVQSTGQRSFATDSRGTIFFKNDGLTIAAGMAGAWALR